MDWSVRIPLAVVVGLVLPAGIAVGVAFGVSPMAEGLDRFVDMGARRLLSRLEGAATNDYAAPVPEDLVRFFGEPHELGKTEYLYVAAPNGAFITGKTSLEDYQYGPSVEGALRYFLSPGHDQRRTESVVPLGQVGQTVQEVLGVGVVTFGNLESDVVADVEGPVEMRVRFHKLAYSTGAVAQFYHAVPAGGASGRVLLAIHGCSSSPDKVLGLSQPDYTNSFGYEAVKRGYEVVAPYILNDCDYIDDFDGLGALSSGVTLFGYEVQKLQAIADHVMRDRPDAPLDVYGISFGAQLTMYLGSVDPRVENLIVSGAMVFDYQNATKAYLSNLREDNRGGNFLELYRRVKVEDLLIEFLEESDGKVVLEMGSYDVQPRPFRETLERFRSLCADFVPECASRVDINFFRGYHETNPGPSLDFVLGTKAPAEDATG